MHEDVVHAFHDAVPVHPQVLTISVRPVPIDPNPLGTRANRLPHDDGPRGWRGCLRGGRGLGLLNDDDRLAVDLLGRAGLGFDDHVRRRVGGFALMPFSYVAIV
jgi:hypothetical protein